MLLESVLRFTMANKQGSQFRFQLVGIWTQDLNHLSVLLEGHVKVDGEYLAIIKVPQNILETNKKSHK